MDLDLTELNNWLEQFINFERRPDKNLLNLKTMGVLCEYFGHPESATQNFHVAGSKGKGTTSANIAAILQATGHPTGAYLSPHLQHFTERIGTGSQPFPVEIYHQTEVELREGVSDLIASGALDQKQITWYELTTIFAMLCFRRAKIKYAIFEVGMGGRLDATNIISPRCCVITPIELEHTEFLGSTLAQIAAEKAGIIKPGVPVVSASQPPEAEKVLRKVANERGAEISFLPPQPDYLAEDAELAKTAVRKVLPATPPEQMDKALHSVHLPGRFEIISRPQRFPGIPYILIDVAHTKNSIAAVLARMAREEISGDLLFACAADKNVEAIAEEIIGSRRFYEVYLTKPGSFKASDFPRAKQAFSAAGALRAIASPDFQNFIPRVLKTCQEKESPLIVLGSFYLAGEVKKVL